MSVSRRKFITLVGGGVVVAATASAGFLTTRRPNAALAPWDLAGSYGDARLNALSFAILAPNPHNRQPWVAELVGKDALRIYRDKTLDLPHTDPFDRQLTIGMGCFLELLRMAAAEGGQALDIALFPQGDEGPVADVVFRPGGTPDPLFAHVFDRRTNRNAYEDRLIASDAQRVLKRHARLITDPDEVVAMRALTWEAMHIEMTTPRVMQESVDLMRIGKAEIEANPDGIALGGPLLDSLALVGILSRDSMSDMESSGFAQSLEMIHDAMQATPAYVTIVAGGNSRIDQIAAGQDWLRLNLAATGLGLALQPVSQALQEYPEMRAYYAGIHDALAAPGETVQMLGRIGYGADIGASPRWPLETRVKNA